MSSDNNNTRESIEEETENDDDQIRQQQQQQQQKKKKEKEKEKEARIEFEKRLKGAKNLVMLPLRKLQRAYTRRKRRPPPAPFPYSEDLGGGGSLGCHHLCFVQPRVSDPPHPDDDLPPLRTNPDAKASSYHDFLRSLLERNDFYSPECNVHREI